MVWILVWWTIFLYDLTPTNVFLLIFSFLQRIRDLEDKTDIQKRQIKDLEEKVCIKFNICFILYLFNERVVLILLPVSSLSLLSYCGLGIGRCRYRKCRTHLQLGPGFQQSLGHQSPTLDIFELCVGSYSFLCFLLLFLVFISFPKLSSEFRYSTLSFENIFSTLKKSFPLLFIKSPFILVLQFYFNREFRILGWHMITMPLITFSEIWKRKCFFQVNQCLGGAKHRDSERGHLEMIVCWEKGWGSGRDAVSLTVLHSKTCPPQNTKRVPWRNTKRTATRFSLASQSYWMEVAT